MMRRLFALLLLPTLTLAAVAGGDETRANVLTPAEAAEGWLLLFDGETAFGWSASPADKLAVKDGVLRFAGAGTLANHTAFHQYALQFQCRFEGAKTHDDVKLNFAGKSVGIALPPGKGKGPAWAQGKLIVSGGRFKLSIKSDRGEFPVVAGEVPAGSVSPLSFTVAEGVVLELRDVVLVPLGARALFNGKTLEGWKEFPGKKSKFTVTNKLEINVKDGPGDLQTEAKFQDFLLQLQCISNGKNLNSGIFFRCRDGEYQNGYEAQIHNGAAAAKDYAVEEYDPKTRELIGKKMVKSEAIDFGTGAIYRRVPARKMVARDGEYFTLTVVAHGNHFATWVNGVQVTDWLDHRPLSDNARKGCRLEGGHLSIQGHDPTTDLSFRTLRIAEYPK